MSADSDNFSEPPQSLALHRLLAIIVGIGIVGALLFLLAGKTIAQFLHPEVFKLTYQFFLLGVVGGTVAWLFKRFDAERVERERKMDRERAERRQDMEQDRDRQRERRTELRTMHTEILAAYTTGKSARSLIRAKTGVKLAVKGPDEISISKEIYETAMEIIGDAKTIFDVYQRRASDLLFFPNPTSLKAHLETMTDYLGELIDEFEENFSADTNAKEIPFAKLPRLFEFSGPYKRATRFKTQFKYPIRDALVQLGHEQMQT
ncbi:MAG: hypothetical protein CME33_09385 [Gimesia sp.]|uniref:hypothetical protein n=1 Tax=Gimesia sp. TaxID=2024833 RepID=UPI000C4188DF|nr:hypothetical protein [Gimesia sp.]MAX36762.1 hypothetical protein [Gimesia sp.]